MDLSFFRRAEARFASRANARLDYRVLVASLAALQASSVAARSVRSLRRRQSGFGGQDGLVEIVLGGPGWREAVSAQGGSFHRGFANAGRKGA